MGPHRGRKDCMNRDEKDEIIRRAARREYAFELYIATGLVLLAAWYTIGGQP